MKMFFKIQILLLASLVLANCGTFTKKVAVFDREILAKPGMQVVASPTEETLKQHMFNAREGSVGGFGGAGGGCGCN